MSLSVIMEEPSGFQDDDLEFVGRMPHPSPSRRRPQTFGGKKREQGHTRYGSTTGRYIKAPAGRSLGGLRPSSQSYSPNAPRRPGSGYPTVIPIRFARNPRHPKSLYDTEITLRHFMRGRQLKLSPELSFPDPKRPGTIRNPMAPRFHHEFDATEEDYTIARNPLAGVDTSASAFGDSALPAYNRGYDDSGDDIISDDDSSDSTSREGSVSVRDEDGTEIDNDISVNDLASRRADAAFKGATAIYSSVQRYRTMAPQMQPEPPAFAPQPPPPPAPVQPVFLPRVTSHNEDETRKQEEEEEEEEEGEEVPPPLPKPLESLPEEDETPEVDGELLELRDMSTQTAVTVQDVRDEHEEQAQESETRFVQIREGRRDSGTMTHENWEAVAPWSQRSAPVARSASLAVNYRRVVAELSGAERPVTHPQETQEERQPEQPAPQTRGDPPPWSPPIVPQVQQILRPTRGDMENYPPPSREWDHPRRYRHRSGTFVIGFWNRCCFIILMLLALLVIVGAAVVTALYVTQVSNCTTGNCGLIEQPGYLGGFVALGALALLIVFALCTWCCYNLTQRQRDTYKYRPREERLERRP